jgi:hypothetical protein
MVGWPLEFSSTEEPYAQTRKRTNVRRMQYVQPLGCPTYSHKHCDAILPFKRVDEENPLRPIVQVISPALCNESSLQWQIMNLLPSKSTEGAIMQLGWMNIDVQHSQRSTMRRFRTC